MIERSLGYLVGLLPTKKLFLGYLVWLICSASIAFAADPKKDAATATPADPAATAPAAVETVCRSIVRFAWTPRPLPASPSPNASTAPPVSQKEREEFYAVIAESGKSADEAKQALSKRLELEEKDATRTCQIRHESQSTCVADRTSKLRDAYQGGDYQTRKAILTGIVSDCETHLGECGKVTHSEPTCEAVPDESKPANAPAEAPAETKKKK
jgi:hypothetical protein